jgi:hypothetical protein
VLTALIMSVLFEFGPLWLVALAAEPVVYGPFWAALVATLGIGGLVAGRLRLDRPAALAAVIATITIASVVLTTTRNLFVVAVAQVVVMLLAVALGIHVARLLHDSVPSAVRTGVASGVSAFSWLAFLPFALVFGFVSREYGVYAAGWMITGAVALTGAALVAVARRRAEAPVAEPALVAIH